MILPTVGAPLENLRTALVTEGLDSVDLWIGTGGLPVAQLVLPVVKPKAYLPVHWLAAGQAGTPHAAALFYYLNRLAAASCPALDAPPRYERAAFTSTPCRAHS